MSKCSWGTWLAAANEKLATNSASPQKEAGTNIRVERRCIATTGGCGVRWFTSGGLEDVVGQKGMTMVAESQKAWEAMGETCPEEKKRALALCFQVRLRYASEARAPR